MSLYYNYNIVISYIPFISKLFPEKEPRKEIGPFICKICPLNLIYQLCQSFFSILHNNDSGGFLCKEQACLRHLMPTECPCVPFHSQPPYSWVGSRRWCWRKHWGQGRCHFRTKAVNHRYVFFCLPFLFPNRGDLDASEWNAESLDRSRFPESRCGRSHP